MFDIFQIVDAHRDEATAQPTTEKKQDDDTNPNQRAIDQSDFGDHLLMAIRALDRERRIRQLGRSCNYGRRLLHGHLTSVGWTLRHFRIVTFPYSSTDNTQLFHQKYRKY